jgi:hypothetical protein
MNKYVLTVLFLIVSFPAFCDDTHIKMGTGAIEYFDIEDKNISLVNEVLHIDLENDYIDYKIEFEFYNDGDQIEYDIGFPLYFDSGFDKNERYENNIPINGFSTSVNGQKVDFIKHVENTNTGIVAWYIKKVEFNSKNKTTIIVEYRSKYGRYGGYPYSIFTADYFYGSANSWKGTINKFLVIITNSSNKFINRFKNNYISGKEPSITINGNYTTEVEYTNIKPDKSSKINIELIQIENIGEFGDDDNADTKNYFVKRNDILFYNTYQLKLLRNLFYAMNGYIFKTKELKDFFENNYKYYKKYKPQFANIDNKLNDIEKNSINVITELEKERGK